MEPLTPVAHLYRCYHDTRTGDRHDCCQIPASLLERFVVQEVFAALRSMPELGATDAATLASARTPAAEPDRHTRRRQTAEAVSRARRELAEALDRGDDPRVATDLARALKDALAELHALEASPPPCRPPTLSKAQIDTLARTARRLEALWTAPTTTPADRQRFVRAALRQVVIHHVTPERVDLELVWRGGARTRHRLLRHCEVHRRARALRRMGLPHRRIADLLRAEGAVFLPRSLDPRHRRCRPGRQTRRLARVARHLLQAGTPGREIARQLAQARARLGRRGGLSAILRELRRQGVEIAAEVRREALTEWQRLQTAERLRGCQTPTLAAVARHLLQAGTPGREIARQLAQARARLGRRSGLGPVFSGLRRRGVEIPPEVYREAVAEWRWLHRPRGPRAIRTALEAVARLLAGRRAGQSWKAIAADLNANAFSSASGTPFTDTQVMALFQHYRRRGRFGAEQVRPYGPGQVTLAKEALGAWFRTRTTATRADYGAALGQRFSAIVLDRARMALEREGHLRPLARPKGGPWRWTWNEPSAGDGTGILASRRQPTQTAEARRAVLDFFRQQRAASRAEYLATLSPAFSVSMLDDARRALEAKGVLTRLPRSGRRAPGAWSIATAEPAPQSDLTMTDRTGPDNATVATHRREPTR